MHSTIILRIISALLLTLTSLSIGTANAHDCSSKDPAYNCGSCTRDDQGSETHKHTYDNGDIYCESEPCHWKEGCPDQKIGFLLPHDILAYRGGLA